MKTIQPKSILLDAMIIIKAHEFGIWPTLVKHIDIIVPTSIVKNEALFFRKKHGIPQGIVLSRLIEEGKIKGMSATESELRVVLMVFDSVFVIGLHEGETEALALLNSDRLQDVPFCTSDRPAIKALALLDMPERGISFETLLSYVAIKKNLPSQYTKEFFDQKIKEGEIDRIYGVGIRTKD